LKELEYEIEVYREELLRLRSMLPSGQMMGESNGFQPSREEDPNSLEQALYTSESNQAYLMTQQKNTHEYASNDMLSSQNELILQDQLRQKDAYIQQLQE
jgi:hypothetical protein